MQGSYNVEKSYVDKLESQKPRDFTSHEILIDRKRFFYWTFHRLFHNI